uniref:RNA-directed DNA polymerase n=1 Tax=Caenorhabditis japonica TaxID=281687 RepID=A0A8R1IFS1_CAEJA
MHMLPEFITAGAVNARTQYTPTVALLDEMRSLKQEWKNSQNKSNKDRRDRFGNQDNKDKEKRRCFHCNNVGHFIRDCRKRLAGEPKAQQPNMEAVRNHHQRAPQVNAAVTEDLQAQLEVYRQQVAELQCNWARRKRSANGRSSICHTFDWITYDSASSAFYKRKLNEVTIPDNFPLPRIDSILEKVGGSKFFSSLDMANGYLQLRLDPESSYKCGFVTEDKVYAYTHLPFGLRSAASYLQRAMRTVLAGMEQDVMMYIDDVLVFSKSFESHVKTLRKVLTRFREYNLKASPAKCEFAKKSIVFLGHEISETNYSPNQANLDAIEKMPIPRDLRAVQRFIGMAGFFRKFIKNFSEIAEPLTKLTRKEQQFEWTREQQQAFEILKGKLTSKPILAYPDYTKEFHIYIELALLKRE